VSETSSLRTGKEEICRFRDLVDCRDEGLI